ncbi:hypothetical protein AY599_22895 [Leptolyngbya valderiana BDU 20041]|nr:hypothetical protein AY599_22895 [Leptolyngbya valderiana BDU 20041]
MREYDSVEYQINGSSYQSSFVSSALYQHLNLDGIIFIGTVKSMWEEVYRFFCEQNQIDLDEDYYIELAERISSLNHQSDPSELDLNVVESVVSPRSKCIVTPYGLNESELTRSLDAIFQIVNLLERQDTIYIDITHSFRSLSLFMFLVVTFLNDIASDKQIDVGGVYYGMLEMRREIGYAPIVNLKTLFDLTRWIKGGYSFKNFGNGYLISELLKEQGCTDISHAIENLSNALNINYVPTIRQRMNDLRVALGQSEIQSPFKYFKDDLIRFTRKFSGSDIPESQLQLELANWYFDNSRYATGYICLVESIVTYGCEYQQLEPRNQGDREHTKKWLVQENGVKRTALAQLFHKTNPIRNAIAHASLEANQKYSGYTQAIQNTSKYYQEAKRIFQSGNLR